MRVILSSCPADKADEIASALVERQVAACVSILPGAISTYRWEGAVQRDSEHLLLIKVPVEGLQRCVAALAEVHPYDVPEILALPVDHASPSYAAWAREVVDAG